MRRYLIGLTIGVLVTLLAAAPVADAAVKRTVAQRLAIPANRP